MEELKKLLAEFIEKINPLISESTEATEDGEEKTEVIEEVEEVEEVQEDVTREETHVEKVVESVNTETGEGTVKRTEETTITFKDGVYYGI